VGAAPEQLGVGPLAVEFRDVTFGYEISESDDASDDVSSDVPDGAPGDASSDASSDGAKKDMVLHNLSFRVEPGRVLGLLGRTGSGKTTLTRLLFRLYDPDVGRVCLGADKRLVDVRELALLDLRQRVGMVTQNIQLFHATVRDNLTFFDEEFPDDRILEVIHDLGMAQWLESLPEGLDTELESGGGGLSAGEAQLLAFTRIFLQDPGLVILDEASSRLDPVTEHLIERAVDKLVQGRTAIVIAHRLRTVERANEIMILEDGRICEHGERVALAGDPGSRFYSLLQTGLEEVLA
jgi:ABC-type multidrug transport system fused ATPase/permease subunit